MRGGSWLIEDADRAIGAHARAADRRASADRPDGRRVRRQRGAPGARSARAEGLGAGARSSSSGAGSSACSAPTCRRRSAASRSTRSSSLVVGESVGRCASFATTFGAQTGPGDHAAALLRHRGTEAAVPAASGVRRDDRRLCAQRIRLGIRRARRALPRRRGSRTAASCSTARRCGSRTAASPTSSSSSRRSTASEQFTAFIVERAFPGVSSGKEEHKMGLHGSSTTPLILQDARCRPANVLGEIGKGHKVAFNVLNYGRFKLGGDVQRRRALRDRGSGAVRGGAAPVRAADRDVRRHPAQARRDGDSRVRGRGDALSDRRADRRRAAGQRTPATRCWRRSRSSRSRRRSSRSRQRDDRLRRRRERPDPRRQRVRPRLPGRAATTATRGSTGSSRAPTRSTAC